MRRCHHLKDNEAVSGIQYVTDEKGRKVGVLIDLKNIENCGKTLRMCLSYGRGATKGGFR
jgi:hypothetical protein